MLRPASLLASLLSVAAVAPAQAETRAFKTDYAITLMGLPVGRASFTSSIGENDFRIEGSLASAGVARIFDSTRGSTFVAGSLSQNGTVPTRYDLNYKSDDKTQRTRIDFADGNVTDAVNEPPSRRRPGDWVEVSQDHLNDVVDPISSTLIRAADASQVCNRTIRIFDGEMRADLVLVPGSSSGAGAVTCNARFEPVAGYRPSRSAIKHLRDRARITISFAPLADTGFYAPVDASVGTQVGTLRIIAQNVEAN